MVDEAINERNPMLLYAAALAIVDQGIPSKCSKCADGSPMRIKPVKADDYKEQILKDMEKFTKKNGS